MFGIDKNPLKNIPANVVEGGSQEVFEFLLGERKKNEENKV